MSELPAPRKPTVEEAKAELRRFADEETARVNATIESWKDWADSWAKSIRRTAPYAAVAAAGLGLFFGRRRGRTQEKSSSTSWLLRLVQLATPLVLSYLRKSRPAKDSAATSEPDPAC